MRLVGFLVVVSLVIAVISCTQDSGAGAPITANTEADIQAQRDLAVEFDAAVNSGDLQRFLALYTESALRLPPGGGPLQGKEAIGRAIQQFFNEYDAAHQLIVLDARVSGNLAFARGRWQSTGTPKDGGEPRRGAGAWTTIRERQADGSWKTVLDIWNRDEEPAQ